MCWNGLACRVGCGLDSGMAARRAPNRGPLAAAAALVALLLAGGCADTSAVGEQSGQVLLGARYLDTSIDLQCPPACVEQEKHNDGQHPITFRVCASGRQCRDVTTGSSIKLSGSVTLKAPDGLSKEEQIAAFEADSYVYFHSWSDGVTDNPRTLSVGRLPRKLYAYYTVREPSTVVTTAGERGCCWTAPLMGPNWVEVKEPGSGSDYSEIFGPVTEAGMAGEDFPGSHSTQDYNFWVLLEGEEISKMLSHKGSQWGDRPNQIQVEWEDGSYPLWARPSAETRQLDDPEVPKIDDADLVWLRGKWIFDCGHVDGDIDRGAWTEIHPPVAAATMRGTRSGKLFLREDVERYFPELNPKAAGIRGVQVDLWINGDGGPAVEQVKCGGLLCPFTAGCIFTPAFDVQGVYSFEVPLPSLPTAPHPQAKFLVQSLRLAPGQPLPTVTRVLSGSNPHLDVRVDLSSYRDTWQTCKRQNSEFGESLSNCSGDAYGVTIVAGWEMFEYPPDLRRVRLDLEDVKIFDDSEGEDGDGEFKMWLQLGPSTILAGDPLSPAATTSIALHKINPGLNDAEGDGESYPLMVNGSALTRTFNILDSTPESNKLKLQLEGYEDDPVWDDDLRDLKREFYLNYTLWDPPNGYPGWAPDCGPGSSGPLCFYGKETVFGTQRKNTVSPIAYDDHVWGQCGVPCWLYSLEYKLEELALPRP